MNSPATAAAPAAAIKEQTPWRRFVSDFFASKPVSYTHLTLPTKA